MADNEKINVRKILKGSAQIFEIAKKSCTTEENQIVGDRMVYMSAALAGVACAVTAKASAAKTGAVLAELGTDCGKFYNGAPINELLFDTNYSIYQMICADHDDEKMPPLPDLEQIQAAVAAAIGKPDTKVWNHSVNPYEELPQIKHAYDTIVKLVYQMSMTLRELQIAFAHALVMTIRAAYACFPQDVNCIEDAVFTAFFYAHMDA